MFQTLLEPHLDYCSQLWAPPVGGQLKKIENLAKSFTSEIPAVKPLENWGRLKELKLTLNT